MLSIIISTFNSKEKLTLCLESLFKQPQYPSCQIIVVDNGSADSTSDVLSAYQGIEVIRNASNLGAAKARNQGISMSRGEWILTLDCDIQLPQNFLAEVFSRLPAIPAGTGSIQTRIIDKKTGKIYSAGIKPSFFCRYYDKGRGKDPGGHYAKGCQVYGACSAAAIYSRQMLDAVKEESGYFDENLFFLFEDAELAIRAAKHGYTCRYIPELTCSHEGNSSNSDRALRQYLCLRNRYLIIRKHSPMRPLESILSLLFYDLPRALYMLIFNRRYWPRAFKAVFWARKRLTRAGTDTSE